MKIADTARFCLLAAAMFVPGSLIWLFCRCNRRKGL